MGFGEKEKSFWERNQEIKSVIVFVYTSVSLEVSGPWGRKESDKTEHHHNTSVSKFPSPPRPQSPARGGIWCGLYSSSPFCRVNLPFRRNL